MYAPGLVLALTAPPALQARTHAIVAGTVRIAVCTRIGVGPGIQTLATATTLNLVLGDIGHFVPADRALHLIRRIARNQPWRAQRKCDYSRRNACVGATPGEVAGSHPVGITAFSTAGTKAVRTAVMHHSPAAAVGALLISRRQSTFRTRPLCNNCNAVTHGQSTGVRRHKNSSIIGQNEIASQLFIPLLIE